MRNFLFSLILICIAFPVAVHALPSTGCLTGGGAGGWKVGIDCANSTSGLENTKIFHIIRAVMMWLLGLVGVLGIAAFAVAGVLYLSAAGDDDQLSRAKRMAKYALIGVVVALSGVVILTAVDAALSGSSTF